MPRGYDPYNDPYSDRIGELIRARGDIAARQSLESGDIWGRGIQNIAGQLAGGVQEYAKVKQEEKLKKEETARGQAWSDFIQSGEWQTDPGTAYKRAVQIWGPQRAVDQMKGVEAAHKMANEGKTTPEQDQKRAGAVATALNDWTDAEIAEKWPQVSAIVGNVFGVQPETEWNPSMRQKYLKPLEKAYGPKAEKTPEQIEAEAAAQARGTRVGAPPKTPAEIQAEAEAQARGTRAGAPPTPEKSLAQRVAEEEALTAARARGTASVAGAGKPPTEGERKTAGYFTSVKAGEEKATQFENDENKDIEPGFFENLLPKAVPESVKDPDRKAYLQAQREFSRHLRPESGGEIRADEYLQDAITYFKQRGDKPELVKQKQAARKRVLAGLEAQGGKAITGPITVTVPNGTVYTFPDREQADAFKKAAGI